MKNKLTKSLILWGISYVIINFLIFYLFLPFINFRNTGFYFYLLLLLSYPTVLITILVGSKKGENADNINKTYTTLNFNTKTGKFDKITRDYTYKYSPIALVNKSLTYLCVGVAALVIIFSITGAMIFNAKSYASQLSITSSSEDDLKETFDYIDGEVQLPIIDKDLAFKLAQAKLGDYGAQYSLDYDNFTIISVERNNSTELLRVAPLEYSNLFVSLSRLNKGTIGYIEVNVTTKVTKLVTFEDGLKYMPSAKLSKDLDRHIHFNYPTEMYSSKFFEIDNEGNPYWVIPTYKKEIGMFGGDTPKGVIIVNPINGDIKRYNLGEEPTWVQRSVDDTLVQNQATNALRYKNGFFNAVIGQKKEVFQLSDGYNYFIKDGETYYVSCITSPNEADQTSIGFIAINLKTKEATRYNSQGITEMRAREIAQGDERVKAQALEATWPILISYHDVPTYFLVLKNDVQDQRIVLMNAENGGIVSMEETLNQTTIEYEQQLAKQGVTVNDDKTIKGLITKIRDLDSTIEFLIDTDTDNYYVVNVDLGMDARFLAIGDYVEIVYQDYSNYNYVKKINIENK